mgnify:CR=1 FL=1
MNIWSKFKDNPMLLEKYYTREKIIKAIRGYFYQEKFHEVETPLLVPTLIPESYHDVFKSEFYSRSGQKIPLYLTTSPESSLKKLLAAGMGNCFEITKSFRNGESGSDMHNPEFTILEWYRTDSDYYDLMTDCERLFHFVYKAIDKKKRYLVYQNKKIDFYLPWQRLTVDQALQKYVGISLTELIDDKDRPYLTTVKIRQVAKQKGYQTNNHNTWEEIFNQIFLNEVEQYLGVDRPTIIYEYPSVLAALAKLKKSNPLVSERFEIYIAGLELADCYSELTDYNEQKKRFRIELDLIKHKKITTRAIDNEFLDALQYGLPVCSGVALGIDRLVMLFTDSVRIDEVLLFPFNEMVDNNK